MTVAGYGGNENLGKDRHLFFFNGVSKIPKKPN
jgi:hypothetical protein